MKAWLTIIVVLLLCIPGIASELNAVVLNSPRITGKGLLRVLPNDLGVDLEKYGVNVRFYWAGDEETLRREAKKAGISIAEFKKRLAKRSEPLDESFIKALSKAKFFYVSQYSGEAITLISSIPKYAKAVKTFLKNGGTLFMDLFSVQPGSAKLFAGSNIVYPWPTGKDYSKRNMGLYKAVPAVIAINHPLLNFPHKIKGRQKSYDSYSHISANQLPLFVKENSPGFTAMLLQEKVFGKGRVIFCQIPSFFRNAARNPEAGKMLENILSYVFGVDIRKEALRKMREDGGPGEDI